MNDYTAVGDRIIWCKGETYESHDETCETPQIAKDRAEFLNAASEIYSEISDISKSIYGRRARFDWKQWTLDQLRDELQGYYDNLRRQNEWEDEIKRERDAQKVRQCNARALKKRQFDNSFNSLGQAFKTA